MSKRDFCVKTLETGESADRQPPCRNVTVVLRHSRQVIRLTVNAWAETPARVKLTDVNERDKTAPFASFDWFRSVP